MNHLQISLITANNFSSYVILENVSNVIIPELIRKTLVGLVSKNISRCFFNWNWIQGHCLQALALCTSHLCAPAAAEKRAVQRAAPHLLTESSSGSWPLSTVTSHPIVTTVVLYKETVPFPSSDCMDLLLVSIFPITLRKIKQNWQ